MKVSNLDFGIVVKQLLYKLSEVTKSIKNKQTFYNSSLRKGKTISSCGGRCLQYLCITVFHEIVAFSFAKHYEVLFRKATTLGANYMLGRGTPSPLMGALLFYKRKVFADYFSSEQAEEYQRKVFQEKFGYFIYVRYLTASSGTARRTAGGSSNAALEKKGGGGSSPAASAKETKVRWTMSHEVPTYRRPNYELGETDEEVGIPIRTSQMYLRLQVSGLYLQKVCLTFPDSNICFQFEKFQSIFREFNEKYQADMRVLTSQVSYIT